MWEHVYYGQHETRNKSGHLQCLPPFLYREGKVCGHRGSYRTVYEQIWIGGNCKSKTEKEMKPRARGARSEEACRALSLLVVTGDGLGMAGSF